MHHIHISTPALFLGALFIFGIVAVVLGFIASVKRDRRAAELEWERLQRTSVVYAPNSSTAYRDGGIVHSAPRPTEAEVQHFMRPAPAVAPVPPFGYSGIAGPAYGMDPGLALVEGMLIGEALSGGHNHTTIINEGSSPYNAADSSYDSGVSYSDSGSSDSGSYDSGGGFDASW